jgi:hypothetical protein
LSCLRAAANETRLLPLTTPPARSRVAASSAASGATPKASSEASPLIAPLALYAWAFQHCTSGDVSIEPSGLWLKAEALLSWRSTAPLRARSALS